MGILRNRRWEKMTPEERAEEQAESDALTRRLKERIEYHNARLAEQDRADAAEPDAA
jgi:hypothetical protein